MHMSNQRKRLLMSFLAIGIFGLSINYCNQLKDGNERLALAEKEMTTPFMKFISRN